jgi:hypothetical protein
MKITYINISLKFLLVLLAFVIIANIGVGCKTIQNNQTFIEPKTIQQIKPKISITFEIKQTIQKALDMKNRKWTKVNLNKVSRLLQIGETQFDYNHKDIVALMLLESEMNIHATGRNEDSIDYGLLQHNSNSISDRYKEAAKYLDEYHISYNIHNKYDIALNIISCFLYLDMIRKNYPDDYDKMIRGYNAGIRGASLGRGKMYYNNFIAYREKL